MKCRCCCQARQVLVSIVAVIGILAIGFGIQVLRNSGGKNELPAPTLEFLRLATYNVHYISGRSEYSSWSIEDWERRKGPLDSAFKAIAGDVIGFQEMETYGTEVEDENLTLEWLLANNPDYEAAAMGDPDDFPSTQPIFYRVDRLSLLDQGWFFFSDTPDVIYSRTFDGSWSAFASWAQLADETMGVQFRVVNLHTDYSSGSNRIKSAELVADRIGPWIANGENVFVLGDFNARAGSKTLRNIESTGVSFMPVKGSTFHFNRGLNLFGAIDHIGHAGNFTLDGPTVVLRKKFDGEWPTDHYPLIADFSLGGNR